MKISFDWNIEGVPHGSALRSTSGRYEVFPSARHYGCPYCGVVWASCTPTEDIKVYHTFLHIPCHLCGKTGSINPTPEVLKELPYAVLKRELFIACEHYSDYSIYSHARKETS